MSEPIQTTSPKRDWRFYVDDMIGFADNVLAYTDGFDQARFVQSRLNYDATLRNLALIGEAATHIPRHVREFSPLIPWRRIWIKFYSHLPCKPPYIRRPYADQAMIHG